MWKITKFLFKVKKLCSSRHRKHFHDIDSSKQRSIKSEEENQPATEQQKMNTSVSGPSTEFIQGIQIEPFEVKIPY